MNKRVSEATTEPAKVKRAAASAPAPVSATSGTLRKPKEAKPATSSSAQSVSITPEQRQEYIAVAAYYRAEQRGFCGGNTLQDWLEAEDEINHRLLTE